MTAPKTQAEWWQLFDDNIDNIYECGIKTNVPVSEVALVALVEDEDDENAHDLVSSIWEKAPDDPIIHTWPGWNNICLLCSEYDGIFNPDSAVGDDGWEEEEDVKEEDD